MSEIVLGLGDRASTKQMKPSDLGNSQSTENCCFDCFFHTNSLPGDEIREVFIGVRRSESLGRY